MWDQQEGDGGGGAGVRKRFRKEGGFDHAHLQTNRQIEFLMLFY